MSFYRNHGKRFLDLALALPALVVFLPLMAVLALLVRWRLGSPVFFRQTRPGLHGQPFKLIKFRSMTDTRDADGARPAERLPNARELGETSLMFLVHPTLTQAELQKTCEVLGDVLGKAES